jgi:nucleoside-diphosphate-sugar epimerase
MSFFKAYQFPVCFTRAANVYGPGQQPYRIIPRAMLYARLGKKMQLHGGGHSVRSFIHMKDVSDATYRIAIDGVAGDSYHISTPDIVSIRELVQKVCVLTDTNFMKLAVVSDDGPLLAAIDEALAAEEEEIYRERELPALFERLKKDIPSLGTPIFTCTTRLPDIAESFQELFR